MLANRRHLLELGGTAGAVKPWSLEKPEPPISTAIATPLAELQDKPDCEVRAATETWLTDSLAALQERNSVVHADPMVRYEAVGGGGFKRVGGPHLVHSPNDKTWSTVRTDLTVEALRPIRKRIEGLESQWAAVTSNFAEWEYR
jgi:hypothetical protein